MKTILFSGYNRPRAGDRPIARVKIVSLTVIARRTVFFPLGHLFLDEFALRRGARADRRTSGTRSTLSRLSRPQYHRLSGAGARALSLLQPRRSTLNFYTHQISALRSYTVAKTEKIVNTDSKVIYKKKKKNCNK